MSARRPHRDEEHDEPLSAAKGIVRSTILGVAIWASLVTVIIFACS